MKHIAKSLSMLFFVLLSVLIAQPIVFSLEFTQQTCAKGLTPSLNIKDSLILSTVTLCLPGILEKTYQYQQIKCEEVVCTYEALKNGLDPSFCERQSDYQTCKYVVGEVFALPGFNFVEQIREGIAQYLTNPYAIATTAMRAIRQGTISCTGFCETYVAPGTTFFLAVNDLAAFAQRMQRIIEQGFDGQKAYSGEDYCSQVPGIEEEVDKLLEFT